MAIAPRVNSAFARAVSFSRWFMLLGAQNPCPCGFLGHPRKPCECTPRQVQLVQGAAFRAVAGPDRYARGGTSGHGT